MTHNSQERPPLREARMHLAPFGTMQVLCQCGPPKPHEDNTAEHFDSPARQDGARRLRQLLRLSLSAMPCAALVRSVVLGR